MRRARPSDLPDLQALETLFPGDRMSARALLRCLRSPRAAVWVVQQVGRRGVLGSLILSTRPDIGFARVFTLMVAPAARGQGLGRRLVRAAEREARRRGCRTLSLEVREDNPAARGLYRDLGYREHARLHGYYHDGCDGIRLRRRLDGPARILRARAVASPAARS